MLATYRVLVAESLQSTAPSTNASRNTSLKHGVTDTAELPDDGKIDEPSRKLGAMSMGDCLKLVSLQTLATPAMLTITALLAAYAGQRTERVYA